jgi:hypothetical protein
MSILKLRCGSCGKEFARVVLGDSLGICPMCRTETLENLGEAFDKSRVDLKNRYSVGCSDCSCDEGCSC